MKVMRVLNESGHNTSKTGVGGGGRRKWEGGGGRRERADQYVE